MSMRRLIQYGLPALIAACTAFPAWAGIAASKHNLSASGSGKSAGTESEICIFCHSTHSSKSSVPMWNRSSAPVVYTPYRSTTLRSKPGQPTYASKLCLSCHDGTIAVGRVLSKSSPVSNQGPLHGRSNLTTDLSDDHPISFPYDSSLAAENGHLVDPNLLSSTKVNVDPHGEMQCTSCHDAHTSDFPHSLVMDNTNSALCVTCHRLEGWRSSSHSNSASSWNGVGLNPWPHTDWKTVAANGCENCHNPHGAERPQRLLNFRVMEDNCLSCHGGNVAKANIDSEMQKMYRHDVERNGDKHDPMENDRVMPRHVACQDCHNPHASNARPAIAPAVDGALEGMSGVTAQGSETKSARYQYEVCLRCHADNPNVPPPAIRRQILETSMRKKMQPASPSAHPVLAPRRNGDVPSLVSDWANKTQIYCTDCHANDSGPGAGGSGPAGPHGSIWPNLLEREYRTTDNTMESYQSYAMCYKCHDRNSILGNRSFPMHRKHIVDGHTPCSVCHDPHGISPTQGNPINNSNLINFDTTIVRPDARTGRITFEDKGQRHGQCTLTCHGVNHSPSAY